MSIRALPFPRGSTFGDMGNKTMTAAIARAVNLAGRVYEVPDTVHGTGKMVQLRVVQNETGLDITVARKCYAFSVASAEYFGAEVRNTSGVGEVCKPLDDAYVVAAVIPAHDLFYVLESGPCGILTTSNGVVNLSAGWAVSSDDEGRIGIARSAAGYYVIGSIQQASVTNNEEVVVDVQEGLANASA